MGVTPHLVEMAQKNETPALILSLLITLGLLGGGLWWLARSLNLGAVLRSEPASESAWDLNPTSPPNVPDGLNSSPTSDAIARISQGGRLLFPEGATPEKERAIAALSQGNQDQAIADLEASLQQRRNDPEALIYLNNARIGTAPSYGIAVPVPIGTDPNGSLEIMRGVAQAQTEINQAGGINGTPLRVYIADDEGDPEIAQQIAIALLSDPSILGVVGHYASDVTLAAGEVYQNAGMVAISPVSTSVKLSNYGDYILRTVPSDFVAGRALADYMLRTLQQEQAAVFFNSQSGYSQSLKSEFASALALGGGQVVFEADLSDPNFNASQSVAQARERGATVLALLPNTGQLDRALQVVQANGGEFALLGGDDVYTPKTLQDGGQAAEGMVVAVPWHILAHTNSPFVGASRQLWGGDVNWRTVTAYDATRSLIQALQNASTPSREGVQQALRSPTFQTNGATSEVRFLPSGDRNQSVQLVTIEPGSRSGLGYDFIPIP